MKKLPNIPFLSQYPSFLMLADSLSDLVIVVDSKRVILYVNRTTCKRTGYKYAELVGKKNTILYGKENSLRYAAKMVKALSGSGCWKGGIEVRKKDGTMFRTDTSVFEFYDTKGQSSGIISVAHDLSEQRLLVFSSDPVQIHIRNISNSVFV